jgi:hypothetical protein
VTQAGRARDLAQRNTLSAAVQAAIAALVPELDAVHERIAAILATEQARYAVAMREGTPLGPSDAPPLARLVTAYVQHVFRDVAPAPQHAWHRIDVPDLVAAVQPLTAPLTAEDQAARAGTALVWLVYRGHQAPGVLGTVGIRLEGQAQQRFHHRQPVEVSYADYAKLKAHCGDAIMVVPPPVWPYR